MTVEKTRLSGDAQVVSFGVLNADGTVSWMSTGFEGNESPIYKANNVSYPWHEVFGKGAFYDATVGRYVDDPNSHFFRAKRK